MDHRDTMNTERTKLRQANSSSPKAEHWERVRTFVFLGVHRVSLAISPVSIA